MLLFGCVCRLFVRSLSVSLICCVLLLIIVTAMSVVLGFRPIVCMAFCIWCCVEAYRRVSMAGFFEVLVLFLNA